MRVYYKLLGGHIHMRVFFHGKMGNLVCDVREFDELKAGMNGFTFIEEE